MGFLNRIYNCRNSSIYHEINFHFEDENNWEILKTEIVGRNKNTELFIEKFENELQKISLKVFGKILDKDIVKASAKICKKLIRDLYREKVLNGEYNPILKEKKDGIT